MALRVTLAALLMTIATLVPFTAALQLGRGPSAEAIPAELADRSRTMRSRSVRRIGLAALATAAIGLLAVATGSADWSALTFVRAILAATLAGCLTAALVAPPTEPEDLRTDADLTVRTTGFGPGWAWPIPAVLAAVLAGLLLLTAVTSSSVDGEPALVWGSGEPSGSVQPYASWAQVLPLLALLIAVLAAFAFALRRIADWPRPRDRRLLPLDHDIRRATVRMLLVGTSGGLLAALGAQASLTASAWATALSNQRLLEAMQSGARLGGDPSFGELLAVGAKAASLIVVSLGLTLMAMAAGVGYVRAPGVTSDPNSPNPSEAGSAGPEHVE